MRDCHRTFGWRFSRHANSGPADRLSDSSAVVAFKEGLFDERFQCTNHAAVSALMAEIWNEYFCWREGFILQLLALQGSPRRWVLCETIG